MNNAPLAPIETSIGIAAPIEAVWAAMVDPETVPLWLGCLNFAPVIGHTFHMQPDPAKAAGKDISGATLCDVERMETGKCLQFSWYLPDFPKTVVQIALEAVGPDSTRVSLTHSGWEQFPAEVIAPMRDGLAGGWAGHVLPGLKAHCERVPG